MKLRSLAIGLSLVTAGTVIGVSAQQFASAEISAGDRPVLVPIEPCRIVDTRPGDATVGPRAMPLGAAEALTVDAQEPDTDCTGKLPADALSLSLNVTAIGATEQTFVTIWAGGTRPDASSLNPAPGAPPTPNAVTVDLSVDQAFEIYNNAGDVDLIVDVNGYYENHNHDDRYYTETETDTALAAKADTADVYTRTDVDALLDQPTVMAASVTADGVITRSIGASLSNKVGVGWYEVDFGRDITECFPTATAGELEPSDPVAAMATIAPRLNKPTALFVQINDAAGVRADSDFYLVVVC